MPTLKIRLTALLALLIVTAGAYLWFTRPAPEAQLTLAQTPLATTPAQPPEGGESALPAPENTALPTVPPTPTRARPTATPEPTPTQPPRLTEFQAMEAYGDQRFNSLEEMPADLRRFYIENVAEIAAFFQVPSTDLLALVQQQGDGGFRLPHVEGESASLVPAQLWNGPGAPLDGGYLTNQNRIEISGGMGMSWTQRYQWQAWLQSRGAASMSDITADPYRFSNGVAALARYLATQGATTAIAEQAPVAYSQRITAASEALAAAMRPAALAAPAADPAANEWAVALQRVMDARLGMALSAEKAVSWVDSRAIAGRTATSGEGASLLYTELVQEWIAQGQSAAAENRPLPWPFVQDETDVAIQESAVRLLGHVLPAPELRALRDTRKDDLADIEASLGARPEAALFAETRGVMDNALRLSANGLPIWNYQVSGVVQSALGEVGSNGSGGSSRGRTRAEIRLRSEVQYYLRRLPEYRAIHGDQFFSATPFDPMPSMGQPFGSPVTYQSGGAHTGVDIRARGGGDATLIRAVEDGTVTRVGPLFCLSDSACRGPYAVVLDHGNNIYTIYSHNSEAFVTAGEQVTAGQPIARQGSEGYSRGPHLHLEIHVGTPYSGDWTNPWQGGQYIDPWPWLPKEE